MVGALLFAAGYALQRGLINRLIAVPEHEQFIMLAAIAIVTCRLLMIFGPDLRNAPLAYAYDSYEIGPVLLDKVRVFAASRRGAGGAARRVLPLHPHRQGDPRLRRQSGRRARSSGSTSVALCALTFGIGAACVGAPAAPAAARRRAALSRHRLHAPGLHHRHRRRARQPAGRAARRASWSACRRRLRASSCSPRSRACSASACSSSCCWCGRKACWDGRRMIQLWLAAIAAARALRSRSRCWCCSRRRSWSTPTCSRS